MIGESHGHIFMDGIDFKAAVERHKNGVDKEAVRENLKAYQDAGITFFREGGDKYGVSIFAKEIAAEYGIDYRSPVFAIHKKGFYGSIVGRAYEDMDDFKVLVNEAKNLGADFIKIMLSGIMDFNEYGRVIYGDGLPFSEIKELINICHGEGFAVMAHVNNNKAIMGAVLSGVDSVEHGFYIEEDTICAMAKMETVWCPSISPVGNLLLTDRFPEDVVEEITEGQISAVNLAAQHGVNIALGSDAGAYMVEHAKGTMNEYGYLLGAFEGNKELLDKTLYKSLEIIKEKFRRR